LSPRGEITERPAVICGNYGEKGQCDCESRFFILTNE